MIFLQDLQKMLFCFQELVLHLIISKWNLFNVHKHEAEKQAYARLWVKVPPPDFHSA